MHPAESWTFLLSGRSGSGDTEGLIMCIDPTPTRLATAVVLLASVSGAAHALDARSLSLGGSAIANGEGAPGAFANPASLMAMQRRGEKVHVSLGVALETRDDAGVYDIANDRDNETLEEDIDAAVAEIDFSTAEPDCLDDPTVACLEDLDGLGVLSARALDILDSVDRSDISGQATAALGLAFSNTPYPFAIHLQARGTGRGRVEASDADRVYFAQFASTLADASLTRAEIEATGALTLEIDEDRRTGTITVVSPEDQLTSGIEGGGLVRMTLGASIARTVTIKGHDVDIGITPKLSSLLAQGVETTLDEEFGDGQSSEDRFADSEVSDTSFSVDLGGSMRLSTHPIRLAAVLRNVIPESIETSEGVVFETGPQLVVGGAWSREIFTVNADLALNEADVDSFPTQVFALGGEVTKGPFALRAGINHDFARTESRTGLSLGLGLGPLEIGARASAIEHLQAGAQVSLTF